MNSVRIAEKSRISTSCAPIGLIGALVGALVALTTTTGIGLGNSWFDEQRILLTPVLFAVAAYSVVLRWRESLPTSLELAVLGLAVIGVVSSLLASRPSVALFELSVLMLVAVTVAAASPANAVAVRAAASVFAVVVAASYVTGVVANIVSAWLVQMPIGRDTFLVGFSNPRFPAQLQALTIPLLPLAMLAIRHRGGRVAFGLVFALWWMCVIGSGSRTAWLALTVAALTLAFVGPSGRRWLMIQAAFAAAGALLYVFIFHVVAPWAGAQTALETGRLTDSASISARIELARIALGMVTSNPLLGVGPMHFAYVDNGLGAHPHNFLLQIAAEWGVPVLLIVVALLGALYWRTWQAARRVASDADGGLPAASLLAALTAWMVGIQFDGYMVIPTSQIASMVVLMLCVALVRHDRARLASDAVPAGNGRGPLAWTTTATAMLACVVLLALPLTPFGNPTQRETQWRQENPTAPFWPRFWQQGWIGPQADPTAR